MAGGVELSLRALRVMERVLIVVFTTIVLAGLIAPWIGRTSFLLLGLPIALAVELALFAVIGAVERKLRERVVNGR